MQEAEGYVDTISAKRLPASGQLPTDQAAERESRPTSGPLCEIIGKVGAIQRLRKAKPTNRVTFVSTASQQFRLLLQNNSPNASGARARSVSCSAGRYGFSSRISHALAKSQSRLTVRGEISRTCTISSSLNPPK